ncbi:hypothetical protein Cob_v004531 [Colletotrichum orbiculare MAFF 240422]|uniref:Uncharacterized protein n=1 Tax=Colletotrichum orbiculare (strain 104-T / ATCC 96160 / CBS 514.97 / LARS 414 / MAFF 240422) TaxID=1213857 RepID=A0A484FZF6_COLOR|nr:hypothetical protein Cob_v004531 [Colletotrichum orbiculare MAFF 240422]
MTSRSKTSQLLWSQMRDPCTTRLQVQIIIGGFTDAESETLLHGHHSYPIATSDSLGTGIMPCGMPCAILGQEEATSQSHDMKYMQLRRMSAERSKIAGQQCWEFPPRMAGCADGSPPR